MARTSMSSPGTSSTRSRPGVERLSAAGGPRWHGSTRFRGLHRSEGGSQLLELAPRQPIDEMPADAVDMIGSGPFEHTQPAIGDHRVGAAPVILALVPSHMPGPHQAVDPAGQAA